MARISCLVDSHWQPCSKWLQPKLLETDSYATGSCCWLVRHFTTLQNTSFIYVLSVGGNYCDASCSKSVKKIAVLIPDKLPDLKNCRQREYQRTILHFLFSSSFKAFSFVCVFHMPGEATTLRKSFVANGTFVWFFTSMGSHVNINNIWLGKCFITHGAFKRSFACMGTHVRDKIRLGIKSSLTVWTFKGFLACMPAHVHC